MGDDNAGRVARRRARSNVKLLGTLRLTTMQHRMIMTQAINLALDGDEAAATFVETYLVPRDFVRFEQEADGTIVIISRWYIDPEKYAVVRSLETLEDFDTETPHIPREMRRAVGRHRNRHRKVVRLDDYR